MTKVLIFSSLFLTITILLCIIRAVKGPTLGDRLVAVNVIGTKTIILILIISFILKETYFIDVAIVYALINFLSTVVISKYINKMGGEK